MGDLMRWAVFAVPLAFVVWVYGGYLRSMARSDDPLRRGPRFGWQEDESDG